MVRYSLNITVNKKSNETADNYYNHISAGRKINSVMIVG